MAKKNIESKTPHPVWGDTFSEEEIGLMNSFMHAARLQESSDRSGIKADNSSAYGYYQFTTAAMKDINSRYNVNLSYNSREEQHYGMMLLTKYNAELIKQAGRKVNPEELYKVHFLGAGDYKKLVKAVADNPNSAAKDILPKAYGSNERLLKGSVAESDKRIETTINEGINKYNKEKGTPRGKEIEKEIAGYFNGIRTPLSKDKGGYKGTGSEEWVMNPTFPNGNKLGNHIMDYILDNKNGKKTIIPKRGTQSRQVDSDVPTVDYDFSKVFEGTAQSKIDEFNDNVKSSIDGNAKDGYQFSGAENYGGNPGAANLRADKNLNIDGFKSKPYELSNQELSAVAETVGTRYTDEELIRQKELAKAPGPNIPGQFHVEDDINMLTPEIMTSMASHSSNRQQRNGGNIMNKYELGGGLIQNQTGDSLVSFDEGGNHEQNPLGGIPQNTNPDGSVNTVEQGETKQGEYVFSDSLKINEGIAEELMLPEKVEGMTFAEASKYLNEALVENGNDAIVKRTVQRQLDNLKLGNDKARLEQQEQQMELEDEFVNGSFSNVESEPVDPTMEINPSMIESGMNMESPNHSSLQGTHQFSEGGNTVTDVFGNVSTPNYSGAITSTIQGGFELADTFDMDDEVETRTKVKPGQVALKGAMTGMGTGAAIGSVIPGVGTLIGGAVGGVAGAIGGLIAGNKGKKRVERAITQDITNNNIKEISDYRTTSGFKEYADGGPLKQKYSFTNPLDFDVPSIDENMIPTSNDFEFENENLEDMIINVDRNTFNQGRPDPTQFQSATAPESEDKELNMDKTYGIPNFLKYSSIFGAKENMDRALGTQNPTEIYQSSGERYEANHIDENLLLSKLAQLAGTTEHTLVGASGGSGATARANILAANQHSSGQVADAMIKMQDYNNNQDMIVRQQNNALDQYTDSIVNKQTNINEQHRQANEDAKIIARNNYISSLSELGKQLEREKLVKKTTGYGQTGDKNNMVDAFTDFLKTYKG